MANRTTDMPPDEREAGLAHGSAATSSRHLLAILDAIEDVLFVLDVEADGYRFSYINDSFLKATGLTPAQVLGQRVDAVIPEPSLQLVLSRYADAIRSRTLVRWTETTTFPSGTRHGEVVVKPLFDAAGTPTHLVGSVHDITTLRDKEEHLSLLAYVDGLTGLPNRRHVALILHERVTARPDDPFALLYVDLAIRGVNDSLGHVRGDQVLVEASRRMLEHLPEGARIGRVAGDEFAIVLERDKGNPSRLRSAERLLLALSRPFEQSGPAAYLAPSVGIALYPEDAREADELVRCANAAAYEAKAAGRGTVQLYDPRSAERARQRIGLHARLQTASAQDQFVLHYQPQVDARDGRCVALEALLRWNHPQQGLLLPATFIDVLEHGSLIVPVGFWVIRTACRQLRAWRDAGLPDVRLALNMSARQLHAQRSSFDLSVHDMAASQHEPDLLRQLEDELGHHGLDPSCLELEVTETCLMDDVERSAVLLQSLRTLGVRVVIDDFGTGYSSLAYLHRLPIDVLKIDRSFIQHIGTAGAHGEESATITELMIRMGHGLGMDVVAEGVENAQQADFLRRQGCQRLQGFAFARPMPADAVPEYLRKNRSE